ncbi:MAG: ankyrin repeat domain-containing protein [Verrucomicrobiota bacterium]
MEPMLAAIVADDSAAVKRLLEENPSLATRPVREAKLYQTGIFHWIYVGDTPLHLAAAGYRTRIVQILLHAQADPNAAANKRKGTPLHYAADGFITGPAWDEAGQLSTLRCLLERGAGIQTPDRNGATPLHRAVRTRCAAAVRYLLQAGADPRLRNKSGSTPFHLAVQNTGRGGSGTAVAVQAQREIIQAFLLAGLSPELKDGQGRSVMAWARSAWVRELLARLGDVSPGLDS